MVVKCIWTVFERKEWIRMPHKLVTNQRPLSLGYYPWLRLSMIRSLLLKFVMVSNHEVPQLLMVSNLALLSLSFICSALKAPAHLLQTLIIDVYGIMSWDLPAVSHSQRSFACCTTTLSILHHFLGIFVRFSLVCRWMLCLSKLDLFIYLRVLERIVAFRALLVIITLLNPIEIPCIVSVHRLEGISSATRLRLFTVVVWLCCLLLVHDISAVSNHLFEILYLLKGDFLLHIGSASIFSCLEGSKNCIIILSVNGIHSVSQL